MERLKTQKKSIKKLLHEKISSCTLMQHYPFPSGFPLLFERITFST